MIWLGEEFGQIWVDCEVFAFLSLFFDLLKSISYHVFSSLFQGQIKLHVQYAWQSVAKVLVRLATLPVSIVAGLSRLPNSLLLNFCKNRQRISVDRCVEGIHKLFSTNPYLRKDALNVLFDCVNACVNPCNYLVDRYWRVYVKIFVRGHCNFKYRLCSDSAASGASFGYFYDCSL